MQLLQKVAAGTAPRAAAASEVVPLALAAGGAAG